MELPRIYTELEKLFAEHGYSLYMVGGTSRSYLLNKEIADFDLVSDATPEEMKSFLTFDDTFSGMGSVHLKYQGVKVDITTLREESGYEDFRHPKEIRFVTSLRKDAKRRDFTINAIYIDAKGKIYDYYHGVDDLKNHLISMIGKPDKRLKEDPLRILRALRFSLTLNFSLTPQLIKEIDENVRWIKKVSFVRCLDEIGKMKAFSEEKAVWMLKIHHIDDYIPIEYVSKDRLNVIDLHCDTLTKEEVKEKGLYDNSLHLNLKKMNEGQYQMQTFAIFIKTAMCESPFEKAKEYIRLFKEQMEVNKNIIGQVFEYSDILNYRANKKMSAMLSLEDGEMLEGKIENLDYFYEQGVRMITLTWNYPNSIGYPNIHLDPSGKVIGFGPDEKNGLTEFGIGLIRKMNELGVIIDVSHLSDAGFYDCIRYSSKPIVASHSNSRAICASSRNLTDDMIVKLRENGGVMGINYCPDFVSSSRVNQIPDLIRHINHIRDVGGIDVIGLGSDFDGIPTPIGMSDCTRTLALKEALVAEGYAQEEIEKIFYKNFLRVFRKVRER